MRWAAAHPQAIEGRAPPAGRALHSTHITLYTSSPHDVTRTEDTGHTLNSATRYTLAQPHATLALLNTHTVAHIVLAKYSTHHT